jgi:hypothetical protein
VQIDDVRLLTDVCPGALIRADVDDPTSLDRDRLLDAVMTVDRVDGAALEHCVCGGRRNRVGCTGGARSCLGKRRGDPYHPLSDESRLPQEGCLQTFHTAALSVNNPMTWPGSAQVNKMTWVSRYEAFWNQQLDALTAHLAKSLPGEE